MELKEMPYAEGLDRTLELMQGPGLLLSSVDKDGQPNVMTIGWGTPGFIWRRPIFIVLVRHSRYTFQNIEATGEFVVNVPAEDMGEVCNYCGTASGRDEDKFMGAGLTAVEAATVKAPLIAECDAFYECRVVHTGDVTEENIDAEILASLYPGKDFHRAYYGEILRAGRRV